MAKRMLAAALVVVSLAAGVGAGAVRAGPIERACLQSDRRAANAALCGCIQRVADMSLRGGDQRRAAKFFRDPDEAQDLRMSQRQADDAFWERYMDFGEKARAYCGG